MVFDSYDTYATGHDGKILHFDIVVAAGTLKPVVEMLAAKYAESQSPEVETELVSRTPALQIGLAPEQRAIVRQQGFLIVPHCRERKLAA